MIKNKVVIITGASQGLGKELAKKVAVLGGRVAMVARTAKLLDELKAEIINMGGDAESFVCDVTDQVLVKDTVSKIVKKFGTIDILVNGAGIWTTDEFEEKNSELIERAFRVNAIGPIYFSKAVLPILKEKNSGHIFNVASKAALDLPDNKDWMTYAATKWAVSGYTKALRHGLSGTKIKVTEFYPGGFESNIFETLGETDAHNQPWMMRTGDVADAIVYALNSPEDLNIVSIGMSNI